MIKYVYRSLSKRTHERGQKEIKTFAKQQENKERSKQHTACCFSIHSGTSMFNLRGDGACHGMWNIPAILCLRLNCFVQQHQVAFKNICPPLFSRKCCNVKHKAISLETQSDYDDGDDDARQVRSKCARFLFPSMSPTRRDLPKQNWFEAVESTGLLTFSVDRAHWATGVMWPWSWSQDRGQVFCTEDRLHHKVSSMYTLIIFHMIQIHKASAVHPKKGVAVAVVVVLKVKGEKNWSQKAGQEKKKQRQKTNVPFCASLLTNQCRFDTYVYIFFYVLTKIK